MKIVRSEFANELFIGLKAIFTQDFQEMAAKTYYQRVCTVVPSATAAEKYNYFGAWPYMREWVDERVIEGMRGKAITIENLKWEATVGIKVDDIEDNQLADLRRQVGEMATNAALHPDELVAAIIEAGTGALCFDGQYFYDTDHSWGDSGTHSNLLSGNGVTYDKIQLDIDACIAKYATYKNDKGKMLGFMGDTIMYPPALRVAMLKALNVTQISGTDNVYAAMGYTMIENPWLTDVKDWYMMDLRRAARPFIFQNRKPVRFRRPDESGNSDRAFMRDEELFGADARYNGGYGYPLLTIKVDNT